MVYAPCKLVLAGKFLQTVTRFPFWFLHSNMLDRVKVASLN